MCLVVKVKLDNTGIFRDFLVDTGAAVSVIPSDFVTQSRGVDAMRATSLTLCTATGSVIPVRGRLRHKAIISGLRREFPWNFIIADVTHPLLGFDFLSHHDLLVDCKGRRVIDRSTSLTTKTLQVSSDTSLQAVILRVAIPSSIPVVAHDIINEHKELFCFTDSLPTLLPSKHDTVHRIACVPDSRPVCSKARSLHPAKLAYAKQEIEEMVSSGYLIPSSSEWSSPIHMVPKKINGKPSNKWRIVGDYRRLNQITKPDNYPLPHIQHFTRHLYGAKVFTCLDLVRAYHSIPMAKEDQQKTAIITPFGLYEYTRMSFGLKNAAQSFQRFMDTILRGMDYALSYLDDILIFSKSEDEHRLHLRSVLKRLSEYGLNVNLLKCQFFTSKIDFLGHCVTSEGVSPTTAKIDILAEWETPQDPRALQRFLGCVGFYRRFIPQFALHAAPLQDLLTNCLNKSSPFVWNTSHQDSFMKIKELLSLQTQLHHPDPDCVTYHLVCDASTSCVGGALHQVSNNRMVPIGMFSKKLTKTQTNYSTFDRELLAAYLSVLHFRTLIEGRQTTLFTDHKPLMQTLQNGKEGKSDRNQRYLSVISEYISDVKYIRGSENVVADALSRLTDVDTVSDDDVSHPLYSISVDFPVDLPAIVSEQEKENLQPTDHLKSYKFGNSKSVLCEVSLPYPRPYIPNTLRPHVIKHSHNLGHFGFRKTFHFVADRYWWPGLKKDIKSFCRSCLDCQRNKITRHTKSNIQTFDLPSERFTAVHIDIVGPLTSPDSTFSSDISSPRYLLTMIDRCTGWLEAAPLLSITAKEVATAFINTWVSRFGVPLHVITDRGKQFESEFFTSVSSAVGFHRLRTCSYRPQCNGKVERAHRTLKSILKSKHSHWLNDLPIVLLAMHSAPDDQGHSSFERVTGEKLMLPHVLCDSDPSPESLRLKVADFLQPTTRVCQRKSYIPKDLKTCDYVWIRVDRVRRPLEAPYSGPYKVISRSDKYFTVRLSDTLTDNVSIDRLKPVIVHPVVVTPKPTLPTVPPPSTLPCPSTTGMKLRCGKTVNFAV